MAVDIAKLGFSVDSEGAVVASRRLRDLEGASKKAETAAERLSRQAEKVSGNMKKLGGNLTKFVTAPLLGLGFAATRAFGNFDDAMTSSLAIMGDLSDAMRKDLSDAARKMGLTTAFSATQAAESYFFLASAGLSAAASIAALPKVAAFAQAGTFDMAKATDILTDAQSALGKKMDDPIENMEKMVALSDVLVKANVMANASVLQFGEALTNKAGSAMKLLNIEVETGVAVLAAWADQGVKGVEAGERFNIVTRDLQSAFRKNTKEFKDFNIKIFDAQENMINLGDIVKNLEDVLGSMSIQQQGNTLALLGFQDRSVQAIRSLLGLSDSIKKYEAGLRDAAGITDEIAKKQLQSFNKQIGLLKSEITDIGIELGGALVPILKDARESTDGLLKTIRNAVKAFSDMDVESRKTVVTYIALAVAAGPVLLILAGVVKLVGVLTPAIVGLYTAILGGKGAVIAMIALEKALGATTTAAALQGIVLKGLQRLWLFFIGSVAGIALAVAAIGIEIERRFTPGMKEVGRGAQIFNVVARAAVILRETVLGIGEVVLGLGVTIVGALRAIVGPIMSIINGLAEGFAAALKGDILGVKDAFVDIPKAMSEAIVTAQQQMDRGLGFTLQSIQNRVKTAVEEVTRLQRELLNPPEVLRQTDPAILAELRESLEFIEKLNKERAKLNEEPGTGTAGFDKEALQELLDVLDPTAKAVKALADARALLNAAFKDNPAELARFTELLEQSELAADALGPEIKAFQELRDELDPTAKAIEELAIERKKLKDAFDAKKIDASEFRILSKALASSQLAIDALGDSLRLTDTSGLVLELAELEKSFKFLEDLGESRALDLTNFENLKRIIDPATAAMQDLADARALLEKEFKAGGLIKTQEEFDRLSEALDRSSIALAAMGDAFSEATGMLANAFGSLAQNLDEGSSSQRAFAIAAEVANAVLAIQAVLTQGGGDPYSAFARMAAMASIVAGLGFSVGSILGGGSSSNVSADQQAAQGAGSVLGDTQAKTESILKASEITADATSELVGINRGMLHALISLQAGIESAVIKLARGAGGDFGGLPSTFQPGDIFSKLPVIGNILGSFINKLFGGKSKLIDEGIRILGGTLNDVINKTIVEAFRLVSVKKSIFSKTKLKEEFQSLGDEVADQFALIFESIRDTVTEAAIALGIPLDIIQARLDAFTIATQKISFKDLTSEEQREELLAVFGEIFDDLALAVIPFINQFQKVGEGLGETLVRVATSVQVFHEAINALGLTVNETDPELFAQMAVGIAELTGGVENFISLFTTFFDKFASDEQKLAFATDQLTRAFADVGLEIPETRDGMIDLLRSLDATTEAGREQIATVLLLASVADEYFDLIETAEEARLAQARELADAMAAAQAEQLRQAQLIADFVGTGPSSALVDLRNRFEDAMDAADALGASQREYAMILRSFDRQLQRMAAELTLRIMSLTEQLFGGDGLGGVTDSIQNDIEDVRTVSNALFTEWQNALSNLLEFTKSILLDEQLSPLTPAERLAEARQQFEELLSAALGGDVEAAQDLPKAAKALLDEARFVFASSDRFQEIFDSTLAALDRVKIPGNVKEFITSGGGGSSSAAEPTLDPIQQAFITALERLLLATDLAEALRDLSQVLDVSVIQLATELGVPLNQLVSLLGVELGRLTADTAGQLANAAELLGADVLELAAAIDIGLRDLAAASGVQLGEMTQALVAQLGQFAADLGINVLTLTDALNISIADLAATFGIGIENFEASQFKALVNFSDALGAGVREVADELKINLGDITDATSLLSQSLDLAIADLPVAIQADLGPLLDAIREATTAADANAAIYSLGTFIQSLPDDIGSELIAFLKLIGFQEQTPEVAALNAIVSNTSAAVGLLSRISNSLGGLGTVAKTISTIPAPVLTAVSAGISVGSSGSSGFPSFAHGGAIESTGLHQLHAGEFVVNPTASNLNVAVADNLSADELAQIRTVLEDIREQNRKYQDADLTIGKGIESGVKQQAETARRRVNG